EFLLAQYFSQNAPGSVSLSNVRLDDTARVLEPVIGPAMITGPTWIRELDEILSRLEKLVSLRDFIKGGVPEQGRVLKSRHSADFSQPIVLAAITRYNFMLRMQFIRLLHHDIERIQKLTHELQQRGVKQVDCSAAGLSSSATPEEVMRSASNWKSIFRKEYSERQVAATVVKLLDICEQKFRDASKPEAKPLSKPEPAPPPSKPNPKTVGSENPAPTGPAPQTAKSVEQPAAAVDAPRPKDQPTAPAANVRPRFAMYEVQEMIAAQLTTSEAAQSHLATATVTVADCKVVLSSWEVKAFLQPNGNGAEVLQQAVVTRAIVLEALERRKIKGSAADLKSALGLARSEAARLQEGIAQARDARNIDAAVNLAATQKRLLQVLEESSKFQES
ncbi:MAG TPA: hypothetical protein VF135_09930, partial [Terriglobales bacterium]